MNSSPGILMETSEVPWSASSCLILIKLKYHIKQDIMQHSVIFRARIRMVYRKGLSKIFELNRPTTAGLTKSYSLLLGALPTTS